VFDVRITHPIAWLVWLVWLSPYSLAGAGSWLGRAVLVLGVEWSDNTCAGNDSLFDLSLQSIPYSLKVFFVSTLSVILSNSHLIISILFLPLLTTLHDHDSGHVEAR